MLELNYRGACVVAAHQHLVAQGKKGYIDENGVADVSKRDEFVELGNEIIIKAITPPAP